MTTLDELAPNYRRARERWPDASTLAHCEEALTACFQGNSHGLVEHVKSFIECVCLTILGEFGEAVPVGDPTTTVLLGSALRRLGLETTQGASKLGKVLSAFRKLADALTEMRNDHGAVAHGKEAFLDAVAANHARVFLHTGDAILGLLFDALDGSVPDLNFTRRPHAHFPHLNDRIDRAVSASARVDEDGDRPIVVLSVASGSREETIDIRIEVSRLLFGVDRSAYIEVLKTVGTAPVVAAADEPPTSVEEAVASATLATAPASPPLAEVVPGYTGSLAPLRPALMTFLIAEGAFGLQSEADGMSLADSLLATADQNVGLDWTQREALQSRLKVACKRVLVRFGVATPKADAVAARLIDWLRAQVPDPQEPAPTRESNP